MKRFWTIPVLTAYVYTITILMMYGYNSYFNIPYSFINASITDNVVYLHFLAVVFLGVIEIMKWYQWLAVIFCLLITGLLGYIFFASFRKIFPGVLCILMIWFLYASVNFGNFLAKHTPNFFVLSKDCQTIDLNKNYIIPTFYNGDIILVSIDSNKKLGNGFLFKNASELGCEIQMAYGVGPIIK